MIDNAYREIGSTMVNMMRGNVGSCEAIFS